MILYLSIWLYLLPQPTHLSHLFLSLHAFPHAFTCVCVYISVFACICNCMCIHVLRYISLDSVLERQCVILSVSRLLPSKPLPSCHPPTLLPPLGFAPPAFIFQVAYGSSSTLVNGCPSFLTFTGRPFLMTHGLDPCFPHAIALP